MILGRSVVDIFLSSWVMMALLVTSVLFVALSLERAVFYFSNRIPFDRLYSALRAGLQTGKPQQALAPFLTGSSPLLRVVQAGLANLNLDPASLQEIMEIALMQERPRLMRSLSMLSTIVAISPLLGLLGTVIGLINAFYSIVVTGSGGPEVVAGGIAEALLTTAFGLIIAIPALMVRNYFFNKANDTVIRAEVLIKEIIAWRERQSKIRKGLS